ncbi:hypothetical protein L6261_00185 [Candidatus Parcubacteria bacterium]|nr:hypothetical protein [Candidatus Parcubacteria bacterium]
MKLNKYKKILIFLKEDQDNIKKYHNKEINLDDFKISSIKISDKFKKFVSEKGFPFKNIVSEGEYKAGIALSLHLPVNDLKDLFDKIKEKNDAEISLEHKAYFIDKIRVAENKPQLYGTQIKKGGDGKIEFFEIEDSDNVNKRRKVMGMESLEVYLKKFVK